MSIFRKIKEKSVHFTWKLAYFDYDEEILTKGLDFRKIHVVKNPYKDKWFADPFILRDTELELTLLVEEFDYNINRGRIAQVVIDKTRDIIASCDIILDLPTHLSFPAIYRMGTKVFVHPENSASGASYIYEYDETLRRLINPIKVLDEPITDAIILKEGNGYKMYATRVPDQNGSNLISYVANELVGPYSEDNIDEFRHCRARMAGQFVENNGAQVRPAQDCEGAYGKAIVFYAGHDELGVIKPTMYKYAGAHTFNSLGKIGVIDIKIWDYPMFVYVKDIIKSLIWAK